MAHSSLSDLLETGQVQNFKDIFAYIPFAKVAEAMGSTQGSLTWKVINPGRFTMGDMVALARVLDVPIEKLWGLVETQINDSE